MGPWEKYTVIANSSSSSNYVANNDGTIITEWMAEGMNTGLQFPLGNSGPTHPVVRCLPTGAHIIVTIDSA